MKGVYPGAEDLTAKLNSDVWTPGMGGRVGFCDHTAGGYYSTLRDPRFWNGAGVSVHFAISQKGEVAQLVNIFDTAFAQGRLGPTVIWPPYAQELKRNPNLYLISTEHEDKTVTNYKWSEEMYQADLEVKRWCVEECKRYGYNALEYGIDSLAGHYMFDQVNRPYCPGTGWPRERLYADLVKGAEGVDNMANLNADGSQRVVSEGPFIVTYNGGVPVLRVGSTDGRFPGRMSKNFGGNWLWFRTLDDNGNLVTPYWSAVEGD